MANNYRGYILKFGSTVFPNHYFLEYSSTPDQRMDRDSQRDNTGYLHRYVLPNGKTGIVFSTHMLHLDDKINMQHIISSGLINSVQRRYTVTFWDDETNSYKTSEFYLPDIKYQIKDATQTDIVYNPITVELVEY